MAKQPAKKKKPSPKRLPKLSSKHLNIKMPTDGRHQIHPKLREFFTTRSFLPTGSLYRDDIEIFTGKELKPVTITLQVRRILESNEIPFEKLSAPRIGFFGISVDPATEPDAKSEEAVRKKQEARLKKFLAKHPEFQELLNLGIDAAHMGLDRFIEMGQAIAEARTKHVQGSREHKRLLEEFGDLVALEDATLFIRRFLTRTISIIRRQPRYASELAGKHDIETQAVRELLEDSTARLIETISLFADDVETEEKNFREETVRKRGEQGSGSYKKTKKARTGRPAS